MSTPQSPRRYDVVQSKEVIQDEIVAALKSHRNAELDLDDGDSILHVSFRVNTTDHPNEGSLFIGTTSEKRTINIHILTGGEVFALL